MCSLQSEEYQLEWRSISILKVSTATFAETYGITHEDAVAVVSSVLSCESTYMFDFLFIVGWDYQVEEGLDSVNCSNDVCVVQDDAGMY